MSSCQKAQRCVEEEYLTLVNNLSYKRKLLTTFIFEVLILNAPTMELLFGVYVWVCVYPSSSYLYNPNAGHEINV